MVEGRWLTSTYILRKVYSLLVVSVASPVIADDLIRKGIVEAGEIKLAERYE